MGVQAQPIQSPAKPPAAVAPPPSALHGNDVLEEVEPGFWQEPWVQNGLPIITSLLIHVGLILIGLLTYTAYKAATTVNQEQVIVPDAAIVAGDVGGIPNPGLDGDPNRPAASDLVAENTKTDGWNKLPSKSLQAAVLGGSGDTATDTIIGIGAGQSLGNGKGNSRRQRNRWRFRPLRRPRRRQRNRAAKSVHGRQRKCQNRGLRLRRLRLDDGTAL